MNRADLGHTPMRVLLMTEASSAGVGRNCMDLAEGLLQRGCHVELIYSKIRIDERFEERLHALHEMKSLKIDMRRAPHPSDLSVVRRVHSYLRRAAPFDVIHAHSSKAGAIARLGFGQRCKGVVYTPHCIYTMNPTLNRTAYLVTRSIERYLARRCQAIIAVSPEERDHLLSLNIDTEKVRYISNGLPHHQWCSKVDARKTLGLPLDGFVIGFLGRMDHQKNPVMLVRAFARIAKEHPNACLAMVGTGPLEQVARRQAEKLGLGGRVFWLGYQTAESALPAFDVFAMPSRYEAMPYVLLEALSAGLPIVSTRVGGTSAVVEEGNNGFVVDTQEPEPFADAVFPLIQDAALQERFAFASQAMAATFSAEAMTDKTLALYRQVSGRPAETRPTFSSPEPDLVA